MISAIFLENGLLLQKEFTSISHAKDCIKSMLNSADKSGLGIFDKIDNTYYIHIIESTTIGPFNDPEVSKAKTIFQALNFTPTSFKIF